MTDTIWDEARLQQLIDDEIQESSSLEYKEARALDKKSQDKKIEITKDVSALANSAGGTLIYGISEAGKSHLPNEMSPIDRTQYSKEWLEQNINNIQPRIDGIVIHPVKLSSGTDDVAYVVEVPKSTTAHQAKNKLITNAIILNAGQWKTTKYAT